MHSTRLVAIVVLSFACGSDKADKAKDPAVQPAPTPTAAPATFTGSPGTTKPVATIALQPMAPFVKFGGAAGDMKTGAHGTFGEFPGGASSPAHTHSKAYHGVVISGVMENPFGTEAKPAKLTAGSYWHVPAGEQHITRCVSEEPCRFFFHADSAFDFAPIDKLTAERSPASVATPHADLEWQRVAPFVEMAAAWGDRATGAHGTFGRFPAKASSPKHTHSGEYRAIVIAGTMTNPYLDETDPPELGPGSYWDVSAAAPHITSCVSDEPCLFYFYATSKFDFAPAR